MFVYHYFEIVETAPPIHFVIWFVFVKVFHYRIKFRQFDCFFFVFVEFDGSYFSKNSAP
jgi:hypothetical protein